MDSSEAFLQGGGEMGARMRAHDWSTSPLGPPGGWPQALRAVVALMINSRYPMFIAWGPRLAFLYNDGYIPIFGAKHPHTLGLPFQEVWPEIWDDLTPLIERALAGEATFNEDLHLVMERNGYPEDTWYSFSYSPVRDDEGRIAGMFCACAETTEKVLAERALKAERDRLSEMFEQAPGFIAMLEGPEHRFTLANAAYRQLVGGRDVVGQTVAEALPEVAGQGYFEMLDGVLRTGEAVRLSAAPVSLTTAGGGPPETRYVDFIYQPVRDAAGAATGIFVEGQDVTDKVAAQAADAERQRELDERARQLQLALEAGRLAEVTFHLSPGLAVEHSERFAELFGRRPDARMTLEDIRAAYHPEDHDRVVAERQAILDGGQDYYEVQKRIVRPDGEVRWLLGRGRVERAPDGTPLSVIAVYLDETERHEAREALRESEARYRTLFETIDEGFCIFEVLLDEEGRPRDYRFLETNPAFERHTGLVGATGRTARELVPDLEQSWIDLYGEVALTGRPVRFEQGSAAMGRWFDVHALRIGDPSERRVALLFNEISDRRNSEIALRASEARKSVLLELNTRIAELTDPDEISFTAAEILARALGVDRAGYGLIDTERETITIARDWNAPGVRSLAGVLRFRDYGSYIENLKRGETVVIADAREDPRTVGTAQALEAITARALVNMPVTEEGAFVALLYLNHGDRRDWTEEELGLVREVAAATRSAVERRRAEAAVVEQKRALEILNEAGTIVAADRDLDSVVQKITDAGVALTGAEFGAFFYNVLDDQGGSYMLYAVSGAPREAFSSYPMPRNTDIFAPTFAGEGIVRSDDITLDPRYGRNAPYKGMPEGHLPVRSYLAVPVRSRGGEVLGGLFFGHSRAGVFDEQAERGLTGLAGQAAIAIDNARLFQAAQAEIARRTRVEEALRELNEALEERVAEALAERRVMAEIVEGTDAFVQVADLDFRWLAINQASADEFERIYGVRPKAGDNMLELLSNKPEHQAAVRDVWSRALAGERFTQIEEFGDPERARRFYEMRFSPLRDGSGRLIGAYQFVYDVTERLAEQQRLRETEEALVQSQKMETIGQLTGGVAHDFNNLLTPIVGALDVLRRRLGEDERALRLTDGALQAADRARTLVQRLLAFSRRQHLVPRPVDVGVLIQGMEDLVARSLGPQIELTVEAPAGLPAALIDPNQLELAILNLAVNARDAMPEGGRLSIRLRRDEAAPNHGPGPYLRLEVADTGVGMDPATLARAVEPFFTTKGVGRGTGLGLSSVHGMAVQSGGAFVLESEPGQGTTASLWLPAADAAAETGEAPDPAAARAPAATATILLVDDEDLVRRAAAEMLTEAGYDVKQAASGDEALGMIRSGLVFDALVTDYAMPGMTGAELARAAREIRPGAPVLMITGYAALSDTQTAGLPRLAKPFRQTDLTAAVAEVLSDERSVAD